MFMCDVRLSAFEHESRITCVFVPLLVCCLFVLSVKFREMFLCNVRCKLIAQNFIKTHNLDPVAWGCRDVPCALLPAGVFVRPVWTADGSTCAVNLVLTLS